MLHDKINSKPADIHENYGPIYFSNHAETSTFISKMSNYTWLTSVMLEH